MTTWVGGAVGSCPTQSKAAALQTGTGDREWPVWRETKQQVQSRCRRAVGTVGALVLGQPSALGCRGQGTGAPGPHRGIGPPDVPTEAVVESMGLAGTGPGIVVPAGFSAGGAPGTTGHTLQGAVLLLLQPDMDPQGQGGFHLTPDPADANWVSTGVE